MVGSLDIKEYNENLLKQVIKAEVWGITSESLENAKLAYGENIIINS